MTIEELNKANDLVSEKTELNRFLKMLEQHELVTVDHAEVPKRVRADARTALIDATREAIDHIEMEFDQL